MPELRIACPDCGQEVVVVHVAYECPKGHKWGDSVELPNRPSEPAPAASTSMRMPFGKHKGELLENIPSDYIHWVLENLEDLREPLRQELQNQLDLRAGKGVDRTKPPAPEQTVKKVGTTFKFGAQK